MFRYFIIKCNKDNNVYKYDTNVDTFIRGEVNTTDSVGMWSTEADCEVMIC